MTYLVTLDPDTEEAVSKIVDSDDIDSFLSRLRDGEAVLVRRASYLDTHQDEEIVFERPKLTLLQGGKHV